MSTDRPVSRACLRPLQAVVLLAACAAVAAAGRPAFAQAPQQNAGTEGPQLSGGRPKFGPPPGMMLFLQHCSGCHTQTGIRLGGREAPRLAALQAMPPGRIYDALQSGAMQQMAAGLSKEQKTQIAEFLSSRKLVDVAAVSAAGMAGKCAVNPPLADPSAMPAWDGWSPRSDNTRFQSAAAAGLDAQDVPRLKLQWAFGLPGGASDLSQPSVLSGRVFVGSDNTALYSLDAKTGCVYWSFIADAAGRYAPIVQPISGHPGVEYAVYFATGRGTVYAVDAQNGKLVWKTALRGMLGVSASAAYYHGRLYVPMTGTETVGGSNPSYPCCRSRGGVAAIDANTGRLIWRVSTIPEPLHKIGKNPQGVQLWGPSGASDWNTPTIDPGRHLVYVGTGNSYGPKAASTSDSILALSMKDGRVVWHFQLFKNDAFMLGCPDASPAGGNCPTRIGHDWDFGGSSAILRTLPDGKDILVAAGKGGIAIGLDPDNGKLLWQTKLYSGTPPTADGLVLFGGTADHARVYYPLQRAGGGLTALKLADGRIDWTAVLNTDGRGQVGAASGIPGVVFTGGWDGILRAVDMQGNVIWSYDTLRSYQTVNGVAARGGSLGSEGPTIAGGMVYVVSGYIGMQNGTPGNVLLAFAP